MAAEEVAKKKAAAEAAAVAMELRWWRNRSIEVIPKWRPRRGRQRLWGDG